MANDYDRSASPRRLRLLDLPNEIISHVFACLDTPSPYLQANIQQPNPLAARAPSIPLKEASTLSRRLRKLAQPYLFQHLIINPAHLTTVLRFLSTNDLEVHVQTVVAHLPSPCSHYHPPWWKQLLARLTKLCTLSIIAPPHIFSEVMGTSLRSRDNWSFNMPYQILQLGCHPSGTYADHPVVRPQSASDHILTLRPWTSILINEGSSLKAYTTWEYWLRSTPSPIHALNSSPYSANIVQTLRHFSLVSIFPIYGHVDKCLTLIRQMHRLQSLFVKLIPEPDSTVLNDEIQEAKGHLDVNDPWTEFETSLQLIAGACIYLSEREEDEMNDHGLSRLGELRELKVDDVKMAGIRDNIENIINRELVDGEPQLQWGYLGNGVWRRGPAPKQ